jgi:hypothetical protein
MFELKISLISPLISAWKVLVDVQIAGMVILKTML